MGVYAVREGLQESIVRRIAFWLRGLLDLPCHTHAII